jgi:hypothetical protein
MRQFRTRDAVGETPTAAVGTTALPKKSLRIRALIKRRARA